MSFAGFCRVIALVALLVAYFVSTSEPAVAANVDNAILTPQHSGKCMEVAGASTSNGALIVQRQCTGALHQQVDLIDVGSGYFKIRFEHSQKCLTVPSVVVGVQLQQSTCTTSPVIAGQKFSAPSALGYWGQMTSALTGYCTGVDGGFTGDGEEVTQWYCLPVQSHPDQLWRTHDYNLFAYRLIGGPFGRQYWISAPPNPSWYTSRIVAGVNAWNLSGTTSFSQTSNWTTSDVDYYVEDYVGQGWSTAVTYPWVFAPGPDIPVASCIGCAPYANWDYSEVYIDHSRMLPYIPNDPGHVQWFTAHEFGHAGGVAHTALTNQLMHPSDYPYNAHGVNSPQMFDVWAMETAY